MGRSESVAVPAEDGATGGCDTPRAMTRRALVTLLFTDLVASTELAEALGVAPAETLRREHFGALRRAIADHEGTEVKTLGDGVMAAFPSAADAMFAAVAMQQEMTRLS